MLNLHSLGTAMDFQKECQQLIDRYVSYYRKGDATGCASVYRPEAEMYSPFGPPAIGRRAIEAAHKEWVSEGADHKKINVVSAGRSGGLGWCIARFSEDTTDSGSSMNILTRGPDGCWKISHCSLTEN
jgi:ketosteroid isomerase-like protein